MKARSFLDEYFGKDGRQKKKLPESKQTVWNDKWDRKDYNAIISEVKELAQSEAELEAAVETGAPAMADTFFAFAKAIPKLKDASEVRPSHFVNHIVMDEAMKLKEYEELRVHTASDVVSSAMACVAMEPELEILFDKVKEEQQLANAMQAQMDAMEGANGELKSIEEMIAEAEAGGAGATQEMKDQKAKVEQALQDLRDSMEEQAKDFDKKMDKKIPEMKEQAKKSMEEAKEASENMDALGTSWGLDPGQISKLPADRRIQLAKKMGTDTMKKIAELLGPLVRLAFAEQKRKVITAREEIHTLELGDDLSRVIPSELVYMFDDDMDVVFFSKMLERQLPQYKLRGSEKVAKGGIIWCEDGSGSMHGDNEVWAKACGLALKQIAFMQKREFYGIHFGSPGQYATYDFDLDGSVVFDYPRDKMHEELNMIDGTVHFAELFFNGGTDFHTPLSVALDKLRAQYDKFGGVKGDIVFCTDGMCQVQDEWLREFKEEQQRLGFKVWGIVIGNFRDSEPLQTICDGRVFTIKDIINGGEEIRELFRTV